jgi:hypothetical protein
MAMVIVEETVVATDKAMFAISKGAWIPLKLLGETEIPKEVNPIAEYIRLVRIISCRK